MTKHCTITMCLFLLVPCIFGACTRRKPVEPDSAQQADAGRQADINQDHARDAHVQPAPQAIPSPLTGSWRSVKIEGEDIGSFIEYITYKFAPDGSFHAQALMTDGSTDVKQGLLRIEGDRMSQMVDGRWLNCRFQLADGILFIHDPYINCSIWFEKDETHDAAP